MDGTLRVPHRRDDVDAVVALSSEVGVAVQVEAQGRGCTGSEQPEPEREIPADGVPVLSVCTPTALHRSPLVVGIESY
jgi:hypothetical protein